ncbi:MAG: 16S rRNA (uracil(1498)-N(3))-methyltransferase [Actinomycetota bacterium]|nr:16S rRNA (uracil(1498)-N(3))-methyltransferase [Actinomycetota bacterium]
MFLADPDRLGAPVVVLDGTEGRHAALVRRLRVGERVDLTDGVGQVARCEVEEASRSSLRCRVLDRYAEPPATPRLVVVQALPKGDRGELAVELLSEVGVDVIVPWAAARCVTRWRGDRAATSLAKWRAAAREATKQARRAWLPEVRDLASTEQVAALLSGSAVGVVLHESALRPAAGLEAPAVGDVVLVVGPEGGISPDELRLFAGAGAESVRLGPTVLRTSTAGVVAAGVLLSRTPRWR